MKLAEEADTLQDANGATDRDVSSRTSSHQETCNGPYRQDRRSIVILPTRENPMTEKKTDKTAIRPFKVNIPEEDLADLKRRVKATRWPDRETVKLHAEARRLLGKRI